MNRFFRCIFGTNNVDNFLYRYPVQREYPRKRTYDYEPKLVFRAWYFDSHKEFKDGYYEFRAHDWEEAVEISGGRCYKSITDNVRKLEIVAKVEEKVVEIRSEV